MYKKMSKEMILGSYVIMILILGIIGYFIGKTQENAVLYSTVGVVVGSLLSFVLWETVGKKMSS
jgi:VIT1/CCC1 family predicted Fe2+/Mn2+ transporter